MSKDKITKVSGKKAVEDENVRVWPLTAFPDRSVADASASLIEQHSKKWPMERILKQRQSVKVVPIASVSYDYDNNKQIGIFYVYGTESDRKVFFEDYPARCCCMCSIA